MDPLLVQRTRYILRSRFRRAQTCPQNLFCNTCAQVLAWLRGHAITAGSLARLEAVETNAKDEVRDILQVARSLPAPEIERRYDAAIAEAHAAICYRLVEGIAGLADLAVSKQQRPLLMLAAYAKQVDHVRNLEDALEALRDVALDGLFEYIDERLDSDTALYSVLLKYKQRAEWFRRMRLRSIARDGLEGASGERALAIDLCEYVLDQGVDFIMEPRSASGVVDLILRDSDQRHVILDAKYIGVRIAPQPVPKSQIVSIT